MATRRSARRSRRSKSTASFSLQLLPWQWAALAALPALLFAAWFVISGKALPNKPQATAVADTTTMAAASPSVESTATTPPAPKMALEFTKILAESEKERIQPVTPSAVASSTEVLRERVVADLNAEKTPEESSAKAVETPKVVEKSVTKPVETAKVAPAKPTVKSIETAKTVEKPARKPVETAKVTPAKPVEKPVEVTKRSAPNKMVVRVGSYSDKNAAEAKRAELMLNGVQTRVVSYISKNGKAVHLLQTAPLPADQAKVIHQRLQLRNYNSQLRNAS